MAATADRVLGVLDLFSDDKSEWTVEDAAVAMGLPVSTTYRYFRSLANSELIVAYAAGRYVLGPGIIQLDRQLRLHDPFITAARPEMVRLANEVGGDTVVLLARLYHNKVICVHQEEVGHLKGDVSYQRGRPMPLDKGAASKVLLANISAKATRRLASPEGGLDIDGELRTSLRQIRQQGFAVTEGEIDPGKRGIAVPVFRPDQTLEGSLSLVVEASRTGSSDLIAALINTRKAIEATLAIRVSVLAVAPDREPVAEDG
ncbi:IclR family transcriptional regulator [Alteraurantiacibacter buctensis]|uniref:Helix-turn-helix domain-containing protein n=1 Tax=Alteraurantiacibacter buctensis TaxID=1503981 RepID=A0A844Z105_9SPHN|nr:IclR family transcriptional regulator C-terminal domain-containing protein [Alteraurantiacibacter buctensis]MXO73028.1 helix-turn-helix domain-containing protein [Alteraurantiacibacter buctensis]